MSNSNIWAIFKLIVCFQYGLESVAKGCNFYFEGQPITNLDVATNVTWNKTVLTMDITYQNNESATAINVIKEANSSQYFDILNNEVFATSCPPVGESHLIEAYLENDSMDVLDGCSFNITVTVVPSVPQISVHDNISVVVSSLVDDLDVVNFTFANTSVCSNFSCFVRCLNDEKTFWIYTNTIRTSSYSILYDFAYELHLTCYDGGPKNNKTNSVMVQVNFKRMTKTGNSAELSTSSTGAYVGFVFCVVHIIKRLF